ncbi:hypothetical protein SDC9_132750 [bioreactor metagenome]|uniref:Uncharacterized protein n=1 Tax=bioreactor metagenome TaxID=1076179 RepID=A0A645D910_9ZZZZ
MHQITQHRAGHDRYQRASHRKAHACLRQITHDPVCRGQAKGASAGQYHGMHIFYQVAGPEQVGLPGARRGAPYRYAAYGAILGRHNHCYAGFSLFILLLTDSNAMDVGNVTGINACHKAASLLLRVICSIDPGDQV